MKRWESKEMMCAALSMKGDLFILAVREDGPVNKCSVIGRTCMEGDNFVFIRYHTEPFIIEDARELTKSVLIRNAANGIKIEKYVIKNGNMEDVEYICSMCCINSDNAMELKVEELGVFIDCLKAGEYLFFLR